VVSVKILGKARYLGTFDDLDEAKRVARAGHVLALKACEEEAANAVAI
jgi:hypothetical protein